MRSKEAIESHRGAGHGLNASVSVAQTAKLRAPRIVVGSVVHPSKPPNICWHRDLPPADAEPMGEHTVEATSRRVAHTLIHSGELWGRCYEELMAHARQRLEQEITRLGGDCAHVLEEHIESKSDPVGNESWLEGRFRYMLYRAVSSGLARINNRLQTEHCNKKGKS